MGIEVVNGHGEERHGLFNTWVPGWQVCLGGLGCFEVLEAWVTLRHDQTNQDQTDQYQTNQVKID